MGKQVLYLGALALLAGCSWNQARWTEVTNALPGGGYLKPYTLDVQQGIVIDSDMVARLKEGMTRNQIAFVLGTPLLKDPFHADRWDYVYFVRSEGRLKDPHNLKVYFQNDKMVRYETDYRFDKPVAAAVPQVAKPAKPVQGIPPAQVEVPPPGQSGETAPRVNGSASTPAQSDAPSNPVNPGALKTDGEANTEKGAVLDPGAGASQ